MIRKDLIALSAEGIDRSFFSTNFLYFFISNKNNDQ
jgi:hypothetical protein